MGQEWLASFWVSWEEDLQSLAASLPKREIKDRLNEVDVSVRYFTVFSSI